MQIKPIGSKLLVRGIEDVTTTQSGIILPDTAKEKPQKGEVIAVGDGKILENGSRETTPVSIGDVVYYTKYGPTEIKSNGEELLVIDFSDVLAIELK